MTKKRQQLSLKEIFDDCQEFFIDSPTTFFQLMEEHIDLDDFIPPSFYSSFYQHLGRKRDYPLTGFLSALILQKILSIPTDSLLISLLNLCKELRQFCGFDKKVPDAPLFTRFKQDFNPWFQQMFHQLVDFTEPLCHAIDAQLANTILFDTSGIELFVKENNPKTLNSLIRRLKTHYKNNPDIDPVKMAYGLMPTHAQSSPNAKQQYINGHFCYADKFAIITNGLGIVRHIAFLDDEFIDAHPEITVHKKSDSPDEDKTIGDSSSLKPVLNDFFSLHNTFNPHTFIGDSAFDSIDTYDFLKNQFHFSKTLIPLNPRNESPLDKVGYNSFGYPTCPHDPSLQMKYSGLTRETGRADRFKWVCPKMAYPHASPLCLCEHPCSSAKFGRTTYTYENLNFRLFPGIQRDSEQWCQLYKIRTAVERSINHFKTNMCNAGRKSRNHYTTKADVFIAAIASQLTVILAVRLKRPALIRSLKPLVA